MMLEEPAKSTAATRTKFGQVLRRTIREEGNADFPRPPKVDTVVDSERPVPDRDQEVPIRPMMKGLFATRRVPKILRKELEVSGRSVRLELMDEAQPDLLTRTHRKPASDQLTRIDC